MMNANVKGMLWTASAIIVGIVVAGMVQKQLAKKSASSEE